MSEEPEKTEGNHEHEIIYEIDDTQSKGSKKPKTTKPPKKMSVLEVPSDNPDGAKKKLSEEIEFLVVSPKREQIPISLPEDEHNKELKEELNVVKLGAFREDILVKNLTNHNLPTIKKAKGYSKYDYIKVKVTLEEHFYVFSRFLVSRMLTLCRLPHYEAIKVAKDLKKKLVEENKLQITQQEVNQYIFELMKCYGYGDAFTNRYNMLSKFYQHRVPLIIIISGTIGLGKSVLATHLAERMNVSNVLQTEIIEMVMHKMNEDYCSDDIKLREYESDEELIKAYKNRARIVRRGANTDIQKALKEGKPLIIEGFTVEPELYVKKIKKKDEEQKAANSISNIEETEKRQNFLRDYLNNKVDLKITKANLPLINISEQNTSKFKIVTPSPEDEEEKKKEKIREKEIRIEIDKIDQNSAVIVPILLVLNSKDHSYCIETKLHSIKEYEKLSVDEKLQKHLKLLHNYQVIQNYLIKHSELCTIIPVSINNHEETLELLQDIIIEKVEAAYQRGDF